MPTPTTARPSRPVFPQAAAALANDLADAAEVVLQAQRELAAGNLARAAMLRTVARQMLEGQQQ